MAFHPSWLWEYFLLLSSHLTTAKMAKLGPSVAQETKTEANSSFQICVDRELKSEARKRGEARSSLEYPEQTSISRTSMVGSGETRFELYGQYNKLIRSFHKTNIPAPMKMRGARGPNSEEKQADWYMVSQSNLKPKVQWLSRRLKGSCWLFCRFQGPVSKAGSSVGVGRQSQSPVGSEAYSAPQSS